MGKIVAQPREGVKNTEPAGTWDAGIPGGGERTRPFGRLSYWRKNGMNPLKLILGLTVALLGGCIIVDDRPRHVYTAPPPEPAATVVVAADDETHYVVYREYFGCSEEEIAVLPHYRRYYGCSDDDFYFCFFVSRRMGLSFDVCFRSYYYDCGRSCDRLILYYRVPREHFFVTVGAGAAYPPIYARPYSCYHSGTYASVTFTNQEYVALVHMRVGVEYQGHTTTTYFAKVNECGGNTTKVIVRSRDNCGNGGRTVTGVAVQKTAPRPWTMPPQQRSTWAEAHKSEVAKTEPSFRDVHKEQAKKVEPQQPPPSRPRTAPPQPEHPSAEKTPPGRDHQDDGARSKPPGQNPPADVGPRRAPPDRGPKPSDRKEETPPPSKPRESENRTPPPPPPPRGNDDRGKEKDKDKGGSEKKGKDEDRGKDGKKERSDRSPKDRQ